MSDKRAAKASRAALLQTKELQELQELPLQSQRSCQHTNFFSQKTKTLKPKQKREREGQETGQQMDQSKHMEGLKSELESFRLQAVATGRRGKRRGYCQKTRTGRRELVSDTQQLLIN
jgi:hypothetical protein